MQKHRVFGLSELAEILRANGFAQLTPDPYARPKRVAVIGTDAQRRARIAAMHAIAAAGFRRVGLAPAPLFAV